MSEPTVEVFKNGPIFIKGPMKYVNGAGEEQLLDRQNIALCRCGHSSDKPFCDGTHNDKGWEEDEGNFYPA